MGERTVFSKNGQVSMQRMKVNTYPTPYTKINSRWIIDLNVTAKTIKFLEENIRVNLHDMGLGNDFLDMAPKA